MPISRRTKWRKQHRPTRSGLSKGGTRLVFGFYGVQALGPAYVTNRQVETARIAMTRHIRRGGKIWISIFPNRPLTKKALGLRIGSDKGPVETWVVNVKPGRIMFEMDGVSEELVRGAILCAMHKLPMKTRFVARKEGE